MPETNVAEPLPNPVIKEEFSDAKLNFRQQMESIAPSKESDENLPEPIEPETETIEETEKKLEPSKDGQQAAKVIPDDVLEPKAPESEKKDDVISEIEGMELPKNASAKSVAGFNDLKRKTVEKLSAAQARIQELEQRVSQATTGKEVDGLREKLKAAEEKAAKIEEEWAKNALESSPTFQKKFVAREKAALEAAKSYLEGTEVNPHVIDYAARNSGATRLKILEDAGLDPKQIGAVEARLAQYDSIQRDKTDAVSNWREQSEAWQAAEQKRVQEEQAKRTEFENKVWERVLSKNSTLLPFRSSKDETWNSQSEQFKNEAKEIFIGKGADPESMADIVQRGVVARSGFYDKIIDHLTKENRLQAERIAKLESAAPGGGISATPSAASTTDNNKLASSPKESDRMQASKNLFNEQLAQAKGS